MKWRWFLVPIKVEQINVNLFLDTYYSKNKKQAWMKWRWMITEWVWDQVNERYQSKETQASTDYGENEKWKRWVLSFFRKRELERAETGELQIGWDEGWW